VDSREIHSIQAIANSGREIQPWDYLKVGQRVRITAGSLTGVEGVLVKTRNRDRLVAAITVLQRAVSVEIDQDMVEPLF
jgi:transcription antitermination factor NusG